MPKPKRDLPPTLPSVTPPPAEPMAENHSLFGFSKIGVRGSCPGSAWMEQALPEPKGSDERDEGKLLHDRVRLPLGSRSDDLTVEQNEMLERARKFREDMTPPDYWKLDEQQYELRTEAGKLVTWGRVDCVLLPREAGAENCRDGIIIDWKFGYESFPQRIALMQLAGYGVSVLRRHSLPAVRCYAMNPRRNEIMSVAVVPNAGQTYAGIRAIGVSTVVNGIIQIIDSCRDPHAPLVPGPAQCQYCRAYAMCPAVQKELSKLMPIPKETAAVPAVVLGSIGDKLALAKQWVKAAHTFLWEVARSGTEIPGYVMEERSGSRSVKDPTLARKRLAPHITEEEFVAASKPSVTALERKYVEVGKIRNPERTARDLAAEFNLVLGDALERDPSTWILRRIKE